MFEQQFSYISKSYPGVCRFPSGNHRLWRMDLVQRGGMETSLLEDDALGGASFPSNWMA